MKKNTLNEDVSRIKNLMRKVINEKFDDTYFDTSYEDNWEKGGGYDDDTRTATLMKNPYGKYGYILVDDENGEEYSDFKLVDSMEEVDKMREYTRIENTYKVKNEDGEEKIAITFPYTPSKSEFLGKFD